jgi:hypothetical protein
MIEWLTMIGWKRGQVEMVKIAWRTFTNPALVGAYVQALARHKAIEAYQTMWVVIDETGRLAYLTDEDFTLIPGRRTPKLVGFDRDGNRVEV